MMKSGAQAACFAILLLVTSPALAGVGDAQALKDPGIPVGQDLPPATSGAETPSPSPDENIQPGDAKNLAVPSSEDQAPATSGVAEPSASRNGNAQPDDAKDPGAPSAPDQSSAEPSPSTDANVLPGVSKDQAAEAGQDPPVEAEKAQRAVDVPSTEAMTVIDWVIAVHDNNDLPFMVIDKVAAEVFLFDPSGQRLAAAPALVGMATGDDETPGTGDRELSSIKPADRMTPAGRFVAKFGYAAGGHEVLWVDYPSAISLHAVINVRNQHRLERLKSPTPDDNRITYGCINVPADFYAKFVKPIFKSTPGVVYILPESKTLNEVFLAMPQQPGARETLSQAQ